MIIDQSPADGLRLIEAEDVQGFRLRLRAPALPAIEHVISVMTKTSSSRSKRFQPLGARLQPPNGERFAARIRRRQGLDRRCGQCLPCACRALPLTGKLPL
ncbi:hypothetical protein AJ88_22060 [Mesorhizobium amorphae CCBAU 01583]|nr:hypothetical protein AJ88_22060 [Mesorhizobium amorphae CCBAU 01583]